MGRFLGVPGLCPGRQDSDSASPWHKRRRGHSSDSGPAHRDSAHASQAPPSVKRLSACPASPRELEGRLVGALAGPCKQARHRSEASPLEPSPPGKATPAQVQMR